MPSTSGLGTLSNERRRPAPATVPVQLVTSNAPAKGNTNNFLAPCMKSMWVSPESDDVQGFDNEPLLVRIFCPILDLYVAWAFIAALYIPPGWAPDSTLAQMVGPGILNLLTIVTAYRTGKVLYGFRGALTGAFVSLGLMASLTIPAIFPAIIYAFVSITSLRVVDYGTTTLVNMVGELNETWSFVMDVFLKATFVLFNVLFALLANLTGVPIMDWITTAWGTATDAIVTDSFAPFSAIFIESAKILFANQDINMKTLVPIGMTEVASDGKSSAFMLETNFGPGLGVLLALLVAGPKCLRSGVVLAIIAHFFGGIHEVYFPYVYMQPLLLIALILAGFSGQLVFDLSGIGYTGPPSPGSVFAIADVVAEGDGPLTGVGISLSVIVGFVVAWFLLSSPVKRCMSCLPISSLS